MENKMSEEVIFDLPDVADNQPAAPTNDNTQSTEQEPIDQQDNQDNQESIVPGMEPSPEDQSEQQQQPQEQLDESWDEYESEDVKSLAQSLPPEQREKFKSMLDNSLENQQALQESGLKLQKAQSSMQQLKPFYDTYRNVLENYNNKMTPEMFQFKVDQQMNLEREFGEQPVQTFAKMLFQLTESNPANKGMGGQAIVDVAKWMSDPNNINNLVSYAQAATNADMRVNQEKMSIMKKNQLASRRAEFQAVASDPNYGPAFQHIQQNKDGALGQEFRAQYTAVKRSSPSVSEGTAIRQAIKRTFQLLAPNKLKTSKKTQTVPNPGAGNSQQMQYQQKQPIKKDQYGRPIEDDIDSIVSQVVFGKN